MRKFLPVVAGLIASFGGATANAAVLSIDTEATVVNIGESFDVSITYEGSPSEILSGYLIDVFFDEILDLADVSFVDPILGSNPLVYPGADDSLSEFIFDDFGDAATLSGISGNTDATLAENQPLSFVIATLTFDAVSTGITDIGLDVFFQLFGFGGEELDVTIGSEFVTVEVVPLPGALLFMLTGVAGVAARRRMAS